MNASNETEYPNWLELRMRQHRQMQAEAQAALDEYEPDEPLDHIHVGRGDCK